MADRNVILRDKVGSHPHHEDQPKTASQTYDKNSLVAFASGKVHPAADNATVVYGIMKAEVAATDSDYATASLKTVEVLHPGDKVEMDISGGTPVVGASYGISNAYTIDVTDTTNKVATCKKVISSTRAVFTFNTYQGGAAV